ncbi:MAG: multicopper oxidase domain-containing protein [Moorea sp. SIO4G3]|nr:multicopper oxidase domain-containing protein [Moorena sp. SIO4G3]
MRNKMCYGENFSQPPMLLLENPKLEEKIDLTAEYKDYEIGGFHVKLRGYTTNTKTTTEGDTDVQTLPNAPVGPTIKIKTSETPIQQDPTTGGKYFPLNINFQNGLPSCPGTDCLSIPYDKFKNPYFNSTNLHTHGLHVSPEPTQDDVLVEIKPDNNLCDPVSTGYYKPEIDYDGNNDGVIDEKDYCTNIRIKVPKDHVSGTFWYHPHLHEATALQTSSAMAGALIIENDIPGQKSLASVLAGVKDRIFVFQQIPFIAANEFTWELTGYVENFDEIFSPGKWDGTKKACDYLNNDDNCPELIPANPDTIISYSQRDGQGAIWNGYGGHTTINGQLAPQITINKNEVQRWRFIDAGVRERIEVAVCKDENQSNFTGKCGSGEIINGIFHEVAEDGITFKNMRDREKIFLGSGYRSDVLVKFDTPGNYLLVDTRIDTVPETATKPDEQDIPADVKAGRKILAFINVDGECASTCVSDLPDDESTEYQNISRVPDITNCPDSDTPWQNGNCETDKKIELNITGDFLIKVTQLKKSDTCEYPPCVLGTYPPSTDGEEFSMDNFITVNKGTKEKWILQSNLGNHSFHIHVNPFLVTDGLDYVGLNDQPTWKDTIYLKAPDTDTEGNITATYPVTFLTKFEDFTGESVFHCHILDHEDEGMMRGFEIK